METLSFQVNLPSDLLSLLRLSPQEMEQEIQHWVALELFRMRKISAGKAAQVAEMSLHDFMDLTRHNIAWIDYTDNELEAELGQVASQNPAFDSLNDLEEDIYSLADGEPFRDQAP
jgi:predicted HTH domain antitoxin